MHRENPALWDCRRQRAPREEMVSRPRIEGGSSETGTCLCWLAALVALSLSTTASSALALLLTASARARSTRVAPLADLGPPSPSASLHLASSPPRSLTTRSTCRPPHRARLPVLSPPRLRLRKVIPVRRQRQEPRARGTAGRLPQEERAPAPTSRSRRFSQRCVLFSHLSGLHSCATAAPGFQALVSPLESSKASRAGSSTSTASPSDSAAADTCALPYRCRSSSATRPTRHRLAQSARPPAQPRPRASLALPLHRPALSS